MAEMAEMKLECFEVSLQDLLVVDWIWDVRDENNQA